MADVRAADLPDDDEYIGHLATLLRRIAAISPQADRVGTMRATLLVLRADSELRQQLLDGP